MQAGGAVRWMAAAVWRRGGWLQGVFAGQCAVATGSGWAAGS